jgi:hypothetical protein
MFRELAERVACCGAFCAAEERHFGMEVEGNEGMDGKGEEVGTGRDTCSIRYGGWKKGYACCQARQVNNAQSC